MTQRLDTRQAALESVLGDAVKRLVRARGEITLTVGADPTRATLRVVQDGLIEQRDVRLGLRTLGAAEVRAGLSEGDEVVLRPVLADGTRVRSRLVEAQLDTAAGAAGAGEGGAAALTNMMGR